MIFRRVIRCNDDTRGIANPYPRHHSIDPIRIYANLAHVNTLFYEEVNDVFWHSNRFCIRMQSLLGFALSRACRCNIIILRARHFRIVREDYAWKKVSGSTATMRFYLALRRGEDKWYYGGRGVFPVGFVRRGLAGNANRRVETYLKPNIL